MNTFVTNCFTNHMRDKLVLALIPYNGKIITQELLDEITETVKKEFLHDITVTVGPHPTDKNAISCDISMLYRDIPR